MRNWNRNYEKGLTNVTQYLDLTYEELKLLSSCSWQISINSFRSYLWGIETVEDADAYQRWNDDLDLTYEELKQIYRIKRFFPSSYLDLTYEELKLVQLAAMVARKLGFRSYLWGIETTNERSGKSAASKFRSYLWGIETKGEFRCTIRC